MPVPIILDCDPGHDDAIAILLAAGQPEIELRAITTVGGNGPLDKVTRNAQSVAALAGLGDVPIAAGAAGPRVGPLRTATDVHGESALDGPALPAPAAPLDPRPAAELIADGEEPVVLVAIGPLTNVADAVERAAPGRIREIVWMGGSTERGNRTPAAEFNAWVDPEAAAAVLAAGIPFTLVGLNVTHQALATAEVIARLRGLGTPAGETAAGWLTFFATTYRELFGFPAPPVHDPCAVALVADPGVARCVDAFVAMETQGRWTRGATVVDFAGRLGQPANARVAVELDVARFWDLVVDSIARLEG